jgi:hypothetical protein
MANEQNLSGHGFDERTASEQREIASKGGKASGEARRRKRSLREAMQTMLALELSEKEISDLANKGYDAETQLDALTAAALMSAKRGNSQAFANVMRLLGEETLNIEIQDDSTKNMDNWLNYERNAFKSDK